MAKSAKSAKSAKCEGCLLRRCVDSSPQLIQFCRCPICGSRRFSVVLARTRIYAAAVCAGATKSAVYDRRARCDSEPLGTRCSSYRQTSTLVELVQYSRM